MPHFLIDDQLAFHAKALKAGNEALGAWLRAGSWSSAPANLTEGYIPAAVAASIAPARVWRRLRDSGLTEAPADGSQGEQIHDFLKYNPSAAKVRAKRESWADRQQKGRMSRRDMQESHGVTGASVTPGVTGVSQASMFLVPGSISGSGSADPSSTRIGPDQPSDARGLLGSLPVAAPPVEDLGALATQLGAEGTPFGVNVAARFASGRPFTPAQRATLRGIATERAAAEATPASPATGPRRGGASTLQQPAAPGEATWTTGREI